MFLRDGAFYEIGFNGDGEETEAPALGVGGPGFDRPNRQRRGTCSAVRPMQELLIERSISLNGSEANGTESL